MTARRHSLALRAAAAAAALAVAAAGGGLPMCVSLLARAAAPCDMHSAHNVAAMRGQTSPQITAVVAQAPVQACHQDATGLGCAAGSVCPTAGPAAPAWANVPFGVRVASHTGALGPAANLISYLAPPLAPPPQA
jgi:hypothetical protein